MCDLKHSQNNAGSISNWIMGQVSVRTQEKIMTSNSATASRPRFEAITLAEVALYAVLVMLVVSIFNMF